MNSAPAYAADFAPPAAIAKRSLVTRMTGAVAKRPSASLMLIAALAIVAIGLYTYYHGLLFLGPYAKGATDADSDAGDADADASTDAADKMIDSINKRR